MSSGPVGEVRDVAATPLPVRRGEPDPLRLPERRRTEGATSAAKMKRASIGFEAVRNQQNVSKWDQHGIKMPRSSYIHKHFQWISSHFITFHHISLRFIAFHPLLGTCKDHQQASNGLRVIAQYTCQRLWRSERPSQADPRRVSPRIQSKLIENSSKVFIF